MSDARRGSPRPSRSRLEPRLTLPPITLDKLVEPAAMHAVGISQLSERAARTQMRLDQEPGLVQRSTSEPRCRRCLDTPQLSGVADVLNSDTTSGSRRRSTAGMLDSPWSAGQA